MFVVICPRCGYHEQTSAMRCSKCGEDLSFVIPAELPDTASVTPVSPLLDATLHPRPAENSAEEPQAASDIGAREDVPRTAVDMTGAGTTSYPATEAPPPSVTQECQCRFKRPRNKGGIPKCMACGGVVREAWPLTAVPRDAPSVDPNRDQQSPLRPQGAERSTVARMSVVLPWGEEVRFSEHLVLGRAAHPDPRFPSLSESARAHLQREYRTVSRFHVLLTTDEAGLTIEDLGAMNGSFVGANPIRSGYSIRVETPCELRLGGSCSLKIRRVNAEKDLSKYRGSVLSG
jgi:hypothetical protein